MSIRGRCGIRPRGVRLPAGLLATAALVLGGTLGAQEAANPRLLSLEAALALAMQHADALKLERRSLTRSSLALREARAGLGPQLGLRAVGAYLTNPPEGVRVAAGELGSFSIPMVPPTPPLTVTIPEQELVFLEDAQPTYFELSLELRQPLFTWLKLKSAVDLAGLAVEVSAVQLEEARRRIRLETAESYYGALLARESRVHLENMVAVFAEIEADRREAHELGLINRKELLDTQARAAQVAQSLLEAEEGLATALEALRFYTGLAAEAAELSSGFPAAGAQLQEEPLRRQSLERSPALKTMRLQVEQARRNAARVRGAGILKPDLALSVALEVSGQKLPWAGEGWEDSWNANVRIGLGAEGSLFDSGRSRWQIAQAEESARSAEEALGLATRQLELAVRRGIQEVRVARGRILAAEAILQAKTEAEANAREAFAQELVTRQQLGLARLERLRGEIDLLRAGHDAALAAVRLEYLVAESRPVLELQIR